MVIPWKCIDIFRILEKDPNKHFGVVLLDTWAENGLRRRWWFKVHVVCFAPFDQTFQSQGELTPFP